jgi:hypothetical protein
MDDEPRSEELQEELQEEETAGGLTNPVLRSLERGAVRLRESGVTHAGWRMEAGSDQGEGAITLVELPAGLSVFRGEGVFIGWGQEDLERLYHSLRVVPSEPDLVFNQLG